MAEERVLIIENACHISVDTGRIVFKRPTGELRTELASDLAVLCLHHDSITISHHALRALHESDCAIITTDAQHMPCGVMHPTSLKATSVAASRLRRQILLDQSAELKGTLWQNLIVQKISNSAHVLRLLKSNGAMRLDRLAATVQHADSKNAEGQAAKHYWQHFFSLPYLASHTAKRQKQAANDPINARLNYGYAVLRAMIAREIIIAGINPILGLGHINQLNPYNLADDIIEPYRCVVEWAVAQSTDLDEPFIGIKKQTLLKKIHCEIYLNGGTKEEKTTRYRLATAISLTIKSYAQILEAVGTKNKPNVCLRLPYQLLDAEA